DPRTWHTLAILGELHDAQGRLGEAEEELRRAHEALAASVGGGDPRTLEAGCALGTVLTHAGRADEAEHVLRRVIALDTESGDWACKARLTLGSLWTSTGRLDDAERELRRALEDLERRHGDTYPDTLAALNNLAGVLHTRGRYDEAVRLYRRALDADL